MDLSELLQIPPYSLEKEDKAEILTGYLKKLTALHQNGCVEYARILTALDYKPELVKDVADIPFIPVRLFKEYFLHSIPKEEIVTTITSSGTTGQQVSNIPLDARTSANQKKVLAHIIGSYIGENRLPLLILDSGKTLKDKRLFGARGAGILGFSILGKDIVYALDENMRLEEEKVRLFLEKHKGQPKLLFGYTFIIWEHFYIAMKERGIHFDFEENACLFHIGGWKKLQELAVDNEIYKKTLMEWYNMSAVHNYYGMAEQLGSVYVECECGHMHASNFSDIIIRNPFDWSRQPHGVSGLIELVSVLPASYPGHAVLTEDEGVILGEDDCPCGRKGKYFRILGRVKDAEIRGCSDTYAERYDRR